MAEDKAPEQDANPDETTPSDVEDAIASAQASLNEVREAVDDASPDDAPATPAANATADDATAADATVADMSAADASAAAGGGPPTEIDLLGDVDMQVMIELGRTQMLVEDVLKLGQGSVVELDKLAGDPVDVYVNRRLVARGEVLVLNDNFCVRISEIVVDLEQQATDAARDEVAVA